MQSQIIQIPSGFVNVVNDPVAGMSALPQGTGTSIYNGQIGKWADWDDSTVNFNATVGTVYGGRFQYVQLAAGATANPVIGSVVFWDVTSAPGNYVVTTSETQSTDAAVLIAGVVLSATWTPGFFSVIQTVGLVYVKFRGTLTAAGAIGSAVYTAAAGGAALDLADVIASGNPTTFGDVTKMQNRFLGTAFEAPTNGGLDRVYLGFTRYRE